MFAVLLVDARLLFAKRACVVCRQVETPRSEGLGGSRLVHHFGGYCCCRNRRLGAGWPFLTLRPIWSAKHIDVRLKINIYKVAILSIFLYGCETWTLTQELESSINSFGTYCLRNIKGYRRLDKISNKQLYAETNEKPLILAVRQRQLRHLGHLLRLDCLEPARTFALYEPKHGSVKRGRPRARFVPYVAKLITNSVETTAAEIETLAQNRTYWRDNIVAGAGKYIE